MKPALRELTAALHGVARSLGLATIALEAGDEASASAHLESVCRAANKVRVELADRGVRNRRLG